MKVRFEKIEVDFTPEEVEGPIGKGFIALMENQKSTETKEKLLPMNEVADQLGMTPESFRLWLHTDQDLKKVARIRDGSLVVSSDSKAHKYFFMSEVEPLLRKKRNNQPIRYYEPKPSFKNTSLRSG